jgi:hypothetical protein
MGVCSYSYQPTFDAYTLDRLRVAPNVIDVINWT